MRIEKVVMNAVMKAAYRIRGDNWLPKDEILNMTGEHTWNDVDAMVLECRRPESTFFYRPVRVIDRKGRRKDYWEFNSDEAKAGLVVVQLK